MIFCEDRHRRIGPWGLANIGLLLAGAAGIVLFALRCVIRPPAGLEVRVNTLTDSHVSRPLADTGNMVSGELRRVNEQLAETGQRLLQRSERKLQQERPKLNSEKLAAIAAVASGFAHAIGTPLGVIRGRAELLLSAPLGRSEAADDLRVIIVQIDQISRLVKRLLDFGRPGPGIRIASDIRVIADRAIELLTPEATYRGVEVIADLGSRPLIVNCDPDQLQEVFIHLGANALDAMDPIGGKLRVKSVEDEVHEKVRLSFEDTGPGVPAAIGNRIFDPFFTTKSTSQADGMGLAISRSVIAEHDGELTLEQHTNGACFVVTLPFRSG